jgi:ribosomal protein S18 acetylase RimI-like enzyme
MDAVMVREARPEELPSIGALRVEAYERGGFLRPDDPYAGTLRALGRQRDGTVLVAEDGGRLLGTIMLAAGAATELAGTELAGTELAGTAGAAAIRALAVAPGSQGRGVGRRLLRAVISRAAAAGVHRLLLSTQPTMRAAHSLYESEGFRRAPELDWQPVPGYSLLVYETAVPRRPG